MTESVPEFFHEHTSPSENSLLSHFLLLEQTTRCLAIDIVDYRRVSEQYQLGSSSFHRPKNLHTRYHLMERVVSLALEPLGLSTRDVEDTFPMMDFAQIMAKNLRPQSWNHRHVYIANKASTDVVIHALRQIVISYPILRSFVVEVDGTPSYVTIAPSARLLDCMVTTHTAVRNKQEFLSLLWNDDERDFASAPGPMCRMVVAGVEEGNTAGFLLCISHSVFDIFSVTQWLLDFEKLISGDYNIGGPTVSYKQWVSKYTAYRDGPSAKKHCEYHARRLKGIGQLQSTLWPRARAPEMFKGDDRHWRHADGTPGSDTRRVPLDGHGKHGVTGLFQRRKLHGMILLGLKHGISPSTVMKSAVALLNMLLTNSLQALFSSYQAARKWPFVADWASKSEQEQLPSALGVAGPTLEVTINRIRIKYGETAGDFLTCVHQEQRLLTEHAQTPFFLLQDALRSQGSNATEGEADAKMLYEVVRRQIFNWLGEHVYLSPCAKMVQAQRISRSDVGMLWNCGVAKGDDEQLMTVNASYDDAQLRAAEVGEATTKLLEIAAWLADPGHWHDRLQDLWA